MRVVIAAWMGLCLALAAFCAPAKAERLEIDDKSLNDGERKWLKACSKGKPNACFELGLALSRAGRHADVVTALSSAMPADNGTALTLFADSLAQVGRGDEALAKRAQACDLGHGGSCLVLGDAAEGEGRLEDAIDAWQRACRAEEAEGCSKRALALRDTLNITEAISAFTTLCLTQPEQCAHAGELQMVRGRLDKAAQSYLGACTASATVECVLPGRLLLLAGDTVKAERALETACERKAGQACVELAQLRLRDGRTDEAFHAYECACDRCEDACIEWGDQLAELERFGEAVTAYGHACQADQCSHGCAAAVDLAREQQDLSMAGSMLYTHCAMEAGEWGVNPGIESCYSGGKWYQENQGFKESKEMFEIGCGAGDIRSCSELCSRMKSDGSWYKDRSIAIQRCLDMGSGCIRGGLLQEVSGDYRTAESMFRASCDAGMTMGCHALAEYLERDGRSREAQDVRKKLGADEATEPVEAHFDLVTRHTVATAAGKKSTLADLRGPGLTVLYLAEPWPSVYVPLSILGQLPGKFPENEIAVIALARSADDVTDQLAEKSVEGSLALRFAKMGRIRDVLGAGEDQSLWIFDQEGEGHLVVEQWGPGDAAALHAAIESALGGP